MLLGTVRRLLILVAVAVALSGSLPAEADADPVIAAAGDIACAPDDPGYNGGAGTSTRCRQRATSNLLVGGGLAAVLPLGDVQYNSASLSNIMAVYHPTWGRVKSISRPILGNHESTGRGYFDYFNGRGASNGLAGPRGKGYYSFNIGSWHLVALNSVCSRVPCSAGSQQERWLRADLAAHPSRCTLAYWHDPRWSSGHGGSSKLMQPFWEALHDAGADVLLSASSHNYERFAPKDRSGRLDWARGIRQFVVGTGGAFFTGGLGSREAHSEVAQNHTFGVLRLALHRSSYSWKFVPVAGRTFTDHGSGSCHGSPRAADRIAPRISDVRLSRRVFRLGRRLPALQSRARAGTVVRFTLSEGARVSFRFQRRRIGRRVGGQCRRTTLRNVHRRRCVRWVLARGSFKIAGRRGTNRVRFQGRISRRQKLSPGRYRMVLRARDPSGSLSKRARAHFRLLRPRPAR